MSKRRSSWTWQDHRLRDLFADQSQLDLFQFPELHKAYLGLSGKLFEDVLSSTPRSSVDQADAVGRTALSWAAQRGDWETAGQLLRCGANPNRFDASEESPLHWSLCAEDSACLQLLLGAKADVELRGGLGLTALNTAANDGIGMPFVDILLQFGANIESKDICGQRPVHRATIKNHGPMSAVLLKKGADINATTSAGTTALHLALTSNSHEVLRTLLDNASLDYKRQRYLLGHNTPLCCLLCRHRDSRYTEVETLGGIRHRRQERTRGRLHGNAIRQLAQKLQ